MAILFKATKELEDKIDTFLDVVSESAIVFQEGIGNYIRGEEEALQTHIDEVGRLEAIADNLRREIENSLYRHSLIPEHRGDVLELLETIDDVVDNAKDTLNNLKVEQPDIPVDCRDAFIELSEKATQAVEAMTRAVRAFFKDINAVKNHLHKIYFYEREADVIALRLKTVIFKGEHDLSHKTHLRDFAVHVDFLADKAESVADKLSIFTIKRSL